MELFKKVYINKAGKEDFWMTVDQLDRYEPIRCCKELRLCLVLYGNMRLYTDGAFYEFSAGDVYALNPGQFYSLQLISEPCYVLQLVIDPMVRTGGQIDYWFGNHLTCRSNETDRNTSAYRYIRYYMATIFDSLQQDMRVHQFELNGMMIVLHAHLIKYFTAIENLPIFTPSKVDAEAEAVKEYTRQNFFRQLTLEEVSKIAGKNRSYFSTYFKKQTGYGWYSFLTWCRLGRAIELLNDTNDNLVDVALASGFCDSKAFFTAFKRFFIISPKEYRNVNALRQQRNLPDRFNKEYFTDMMDRYRREGP